MSSSPVGDVVVLGLGNILMQDEGIGVHVIRHLEEHFHFEPEIEIVDGGTSGLDLLPFFASEKKMLIIDAVNFDSAPGTIGVLEDDAILAQLDPKISLHHLGLSDVISVSELLDKKPKRMILLGIQPSSMELDLEMTELIKEAMPEMVRNSLKILSDWGISSSKKMI